MHTVQQRRLLACVIAIVFYLLTGTASAQSELPTLYQPADIILDTDPGADPDDMSDIAILHTLATIGEARILAIMGALPQKYAAPTIEIMNRYNGRPNIAIGVTRTGNTNLTEGYAELIAKFYPNTIQSSANVPDATALYRQILAGRPDSSVTVVFVGPVRNLHNVYRSGPDQFSELTGAELLKKKIKRLVIVAGYFRGLPVAEWNIVADLEASSTLNLIDPDLPVTFVGTEQGDDVSIPREGILKMSPLNPVHPAHRQAAFDKRPSWGGMGLLLALRGHAWRGTNLFKPVPGKIVVQQNGLTHWDATATDTKHERVERVQNADYYIGVLSDLLMRDSHKLDATGDTLVLGYNTLMVALGFGDPNTGFRRGGEHLVDVAIREKTTARFSETGINLPNNSTNRNASAGIFWNSGNMYSPLVAGLIRDTNGGVRVVTNTAGGHGMISMNSAKLVGAGGSQGQLQAKIGGGVRTLDEAGRLAGHQAASVSLGAAGVRLSPGEVSVKGTDVDAKKRNVLEVRDGLSGQFTDVAALRYNIGGRAGGANQLLGVSATGLVAEYKQLRAGTNMLIAYAPGAIELNASVSLAGLGPARGPSLLDNAANEQSWLWSLNQDRSHGLMIGESTASPGMETSLLRVETRAGSKAVPMMARAGGVGQAVIELRSASRNGDVADTVYHGRFVSTNSLPASMFFVPCEPGALTTIKATIRASALGAPNQPSAMYILTGAFKVANGRATAVGLGPGTLYVVEDNAAWDARLKTSEIASEVEFEVRGDANANVTWHATIEVSVMAEVAN